MPGGTRGSFFLKSRGGHAGDNPKKEGFFKAKFGGPQRADTARKVEGGRVEKPKDIKTFDKKTYRIKKYSNKYKLDKWENQRRKEVLKKYYKDIKKDPMAGKYTPFDFDKAAADGGDDSEGDDADKDDDKSPKPETAEDTQVRYVLHPDRLEQAKQKQRSMAKSGAEGKAKPLEERLDKRGKIQPFWKVKQEMQRLREEKSAKKEAMAAAAKEREEAIAKYKQKKADKFKKLSKKTKTGQPLMKDRMQMLLESIQKTTNNNN